MSNYTIVDRRVNPTGKNLSNRQRFLGRVRDWVKKKVRQRSSERQITSNDGESISISGNDVSEPVFDYNYQSGNWDRVLPGNRDYMPGDKIKRPPSGSGGSGTAASDDASDDNFVFTINKEEYLNILFEDLELPDLIKESDNATITFERKRSGFSTSGTPNNLDLEKSLKNALCRKIALAVPLDRKIKEKKKEISEETDEEKLIQLNEELSKLISRRLAITFIDQVDVRYKRFSQIPLPNSQAVVFCLMDVSGSMGEKEKEIAKRFFLLLYLFLIRKYNTVKIEFVRHTTVASRCTEQQFFYDRESGGTIVSTGVKLVNSIIDSEYPLDLWNVYVVQASDGDNMVSDSSYLKEDLEKLIPKCQYYVYNEVRTNYSYNSTTTNVFDTMKEVNEMYKNLNIVNIPSVDEVVPTFRKIFIKKEKHGK